MASAQDIQLENVITDALKTGDVEALNGLLERDIHEETPVKCSQQFVTKLDKLITRSLDKKDLRSASLGFSCLLKFGKNLKVPGGGLGLSGLIAKGVIEKMMEWFEKCRQLWIHCGPRWDQTLFNLAEDFLNVLMAVHEACTTGAIQVTESFLYPVGQLAVDPRIYIRIQKEAVHKLNLILDKIPIELKKYKKILTSQEASDIMIKVAGQILESGDYDLQSSLMEALCRMATHEQRKQQADRWFSMAHVASEFAKVPDSEFETACRNFLNMVNGMQGDRRRVHSFPCLEAYLGKHELLMPSDEKLEEFWIDFNFGSHSISFYFSLPNEDAQEGHWETICIADNEVQSYSVAEKGKTKVLQISLTEVVIVGEVEGSSITIHFSSALDILQAAHNVYGASKDKGTSAAKMTGITVKNENNMQVVPESQLSLGESEKNTAPYLVSAAAAAAPLQVQQAETDLHAKGKCKGRTSAAPVKASVTAKILQEKSPRCVNAETKNALSSREKRDSEVAGNMVKLISSQYEKKTQSTVKDKAVDAQQNWVPPLATRKDVFAFSCDMPQNIEKKRYMKKHLFSDTETDNAMTEVSWLGESSRQPKPKVTKYSRRRPIKGRAECEPPDLLPTSPKAVAKKPTKKKTNSKKVQDQPRRAVKPTAPSSKPLEANKRPKRAAATLSKSYKDHDTDDSLSEPEVPSTSKEKPENVLQETSKLSKKNPLKDSWTACQTSLWLPPPSIEMTRSADVSAPIVDLTCSPLLTPRGSPLPSSPNPSCHNSPSPILLVPRPHSTISSKGKCQPFSFYSAVKNHNASKTQSFLSNPSLPLGDQTPALSSSTGFSAAKVGKNQQHLSLAPQSPLSTQPLLTSTLLELEKHTMPSLAQSPREGTVNPGCHYHFSEASSVSQVSPSQSSIMSSLLTSSIKELSNKVEKTPLSDQDQSVAQIHVSGPSRKRHISLTSESENDEKKGGRKKDIKKSKMRGKCSPRMKPRRLFKSFEVPAVDEVSQMKSSYMSSHHCEVEAFDVDMDEDLSEMPLKPGNLCQQLSSELNKKSQNRYNVMEVYNKQSLKTIQQHVSSVSMQITKSRIQKFEQVQKVLLEEIHQLQQEDTLLKSMEKDLTMCWTKLNTTFHSSHTQEARSHFLLTNLYDILPNSSSMSQPSKILLLCLLFQMCLIKKDMKSVQDRFLTEMLEGELQSIKRGLHALFFL
ncbi:uncharacterized protein sycp2 [Pholidichthys leucotaenia]